MICSGNKNNSNNSDHSVYIYIDTQKIHKMFPKSRSQVIILAMPLTPGLLVIGDGERILAAKEPPNSMTDHHVLIRIAGSGYPAFLDKPA